MRICIINEFFYPDDGGGTGSVLSDLAGSLRRDHPDVEIDVVTSRNLYRQWSARLPAYEEWNGVRIFRLDTPHPGGLPTARRLAVNARFGVAALAKLRRLPRYDLVLIGTAPPVVALAADLYRASTKTPYLYVIYDLDPDRAINLGVLSPRNPLAVALRRCQRRWLHRAARTVVLGRCMEEHVRGAYGLRAEQVAVIPVGGDADAIRPASRHTRFRTRHGLDGFVVCYSGNFGRYHNFDTVLDAAKALRTSEPQVTFVLVGGGAQESRIIARIADENICNVRTFPFVAKADYADLLASADASLVTLEPGMEGLCVPSKFYSILASGRPTVALVSPASEVARVVTEAACGVQVGQGDVAGLVRTITHLAHNPDEARRMGENARRVLVEKHSLRHVAARYYQVMQEAIGAPQEKPSPETAWELSDHERQVPEVSCL